ncbi:hypothetical protein [Brevibacillus laterosporus]|nr:hypothetical protein [Brevibacillus laterosporus]
MKKWGFFVIIIVLLLGYKTIFQDTNYTKRMVSIVKNMRSIHILLPKR